jgi:glycosyltransferase involved in cell wall biosynthesis
VDDGSKDHTAEIARLVGAEVITHSKNGGYGAAIKTCFETAKSCNADVMIIIDADGQHSPDDIPILLGEINNSHADIVIGSRFINGNGHNQKIPAYRIVGMRVLDTATKAGSGIHITDSQSGFRAYSKKAINFIDLGNNGMAAGSEILIQASDKKMKISEVPISVRYDIKGTSSKSPITHGFEVLGNIVGLISQRRPLLFFCIPGAVLLIIGIIASLFTIIDYNVTRNIPVLPAMFSALCILIGIFSIFTGFILSAIQDARFKGKIELS